MMMVIIKRRTPCRSVCRACLVPTRFSRVHQHLQEFKNNLFYPSCQSHAQSSSVARCSKKLARKLQCFKLKTDSWTTITYFQWMFRLSAEEHNQDCQVQYSHSSQGQTQDQTHAEPQCQWCDLQPHATWGRSLFSFSKDYNKWLLNCQFPLKLSSSRKISASGEKVMPLYSTLHLHNKVSQ